MGIIKTGNSTMRIALNSDNKIDGISLDDVAVGQTGRTINQGYIFSQKQDLRFSTKEATDVNRFYGDKLGISATDAGVFKLNTTPAILECTDTNILKIM